MKAIEKTLYQIDCKCKDGRYGEYYEITFVDTEGDIYKTYAVPGFDNYDTWRWICEHQDNAVTIQNACQKTRYRKPVFTDDKCPIIDCDSVIKPVNVKPLDQQLKEVYNWFK